MTDIRYPLNSSLKDTDRAYAVHTALQARLAAEPDAEELRKTSFSFTTGSQFSSGRPINLSLGSGLSLLRRKSVREPKEGFDLDQLVVLVRERRAQERASDEATDAKNAKADANRERLQALVPDALRLTVLVRADAEGYCEVRVRTPLAGGELAVKAIVAALTKAAGEAG